ncbi:MAG TPA: PKD domain-containing protein, partial [Thermoanaerobaculia bacterium]
RNPSGFSQVMPRMGKFLGDHFYRAAWTIMEAHQRVNLDPTIGLFGPIDGYPGTAQTFTASANNCTPASTWQWSAGADATVTGSGSSVQIAWSTLGPKVVVATNASCGNALAEHVVTILDPAPKIGNVTVSPASATVCQPITFTATGVTGQPPLTRTWEVLPAVTGLQQNGDSATWTPGENDLGTYEGSLTVSGVGPSAVDSATVIVSGLDPLPGAGFAIDNDDFTGSKVKFHAAVPGATAWSWDFGTGQFGSFTSDPVAGPHPEHTFSCGQAVCTFNVRVQVKNCVETTPVVSATLQVIIDNPLEVRSFSPVCSLGICGFSTGENITFAIDASGDPQQYQFDWEAKGSFQAATPSTCPGGIAGTCFQHAYATAGTYLPLVKIVRDGQESDPLQASKAVIVVKPTNVPPPPPPPTKNITVIGPTTGNVGQALTYTASATGCTAAANGWSWNTGGGSGSSTTSSITITFATTGTRAVTATNSGCSGVSGSRTVNIGVNQSTLAANFTYAPALPKAGDKVTFDGSASAGGPEFYFWKINGETIQGKTAEYTFTAAGSYAVTLEVSKVDKSCQLGMCSASTTKTVVVLPTTPEPPPPPPPPPALGNGCAGADADDDSLLCLLDGRFRVRVEWVNQHADGQAGVGTSVRSAATGDTTGFFWFFNADNIELLVKMLDGTTVNGHYWFFHGGLSDVFYEITVEDTVAGTSRTYTKLANAIGGGGDAAAFPADAGAAGAASVAAPQRLTGALHQGTGGGDGGGEVESSDHLSLLDGRFEVSVDFLNQHSGDEAGLGRAVAGTNNAGYFWFFTQDNLELVVKMIDARPFDGHFWVFWTGLSDVKYNIEVKDTETGETWEFHNPAGKVGGGADTSAFGD